MTPELGLRARKTWLATGPSAEPAPRRTHAAQEAACVPSEARPAGRRARLDFTTCHSRESFAKDDCVAVLDLYHVGITTTDLSLGLDRRASRTTRLSY
jgi:hypothetical protein